MPRSKKRIENPGHTGYTPEHKRIGLSNPYVSPVKPTLPFLERSEPWEEYSSRLSPFIPPPDITPTGNLRDPAYHLQIDLVMAKSRIFNLEMNMREKDKMIEFLKEKIKNGESKSIEPTHIDFTFSPNSFLVESDNFISSPTVDKPLTQPNPPVLFRSSSNVIRTSWWMM
jgi:hypothetical protein